MATKETKYGKATVTDWGEPGYLDGAMMQFAVSVRKRGEKFDRLVAYVGDRKDAVAIARLLGGVSAHKRPDGAVDTISGK